MNPGDRVRFNEKCPWPERVGSEGVLVAPPCDHYPQPGASEVLLLLDSDPLNATHADGDCIWTCVAEKSSLAPVGPEGT